MKSKTNLDVGEKYCIGTDPLNVILYEKQIITGNNKTGKKVKPENIGTERLKAIGFFATTQGALHYMVEHEIKCVGFDDFEKLNKKVDGLHSLIDVLKNKVLPTI
ncbi:hypothetical protein M0R04_08620 [Candidatus Dojkabacteria bacterium]|jgi:hypothetical protein|nr:hypothetical protein [Candidatus Dojkabacteria bacterium]